MMKLCERCHKPAKLTKVFRTERFEEGKDDTMKVCPHSDILPWLKHMGF